jgi:hypothetical protein
MEEVWKDIEEYEGLYQVSNFGRVKSSLTNRIMTPQLHKVGYYRVGLRKDGNRKFYLVHRLVAGAFIPNTDNLPEVNHKDEDKINNFVWVNEDGSVDLEKSNLEWCDRIYNVRFGLGSYKSKQSRLRPVIGFDGEHTLGVCFQNAASADKFYSRNKNKTEEVSRCAAGKIKTAYGFRWEYLER